MKYEIGDFVSKPVTAFLETFFKLYPTATEKELAYYISGNVLEPIGRVCDPTVPMNQKTWGVSHYIMEDVGPGSEFLKLNFKRPTDFGYDESIIGTGKCSSMVCTIGESSCAAAMDGIMKPYQS